MIDQKSRDQIWMELLDKVEDESIKAYFQSRLLPNINWFHFAARANKKKYMTWSVVSLVVSAIIPVASVFSDGSMFMKALLAALGSTVTFIGGYLMLYDSRNMWNCYSTAREELVRTAFQYFTKTGEFSACSNESERNKLLIDQSEAIMGKIHEMYGKDDKETQGVPVN